MRQEKGQVLVETALILPVLVVILLGIYDVSYTLYALNTLNHAAQAAARQAAVQSPPPVPAAAASVTAGGGIAGAASRNLFNGIDQSNVRYELKVFDQNGNAAAQAQSGYTVQVVLTYKNFKTFTGLIGDSISSQSSMRYE
ncbi:pilus assembly protein [Geomonas sp. Red32]|uniref:TadE family protein n=1 Tax=Geomonas sp. Red32 TaxID=2912856 RepID=UPI00202CF4D7|nr:TadE family protein [Geomonas sp. Red32]MCM0082877.1 pilus assembly protein [Geomonas sp. Red32]